MCRLSVPLSVYTLCDFLDFVSAHFFFLVQPVRFGSVPSATLLCRRASVMEEMSGCVTDICTRYRLFPIFVVVRVGDVGVVFLRKMYLVN